MAERTRSCAAACLIAILTTALPAIAGGPVIERIRHASGDDYTRVVVDVSGAADYRAAFLEPQAGQPPRFYLDLAGVAVGTSPSVTSVSDARVRRVRIGQYRSGTARVVMELARPMRPHVFTLDRPPRIVIDFTDLPTPQVVRAPQALPAKARTGEARADAAVAGRRAPLTVVIDPGHGGRDPGAHSAGGMREKEVVLDISARVAEKLRRGMRARVLMTRGDDSTVSLAQRKDLANRGDADLFVSIHANASRNRSAHGIETYYLKNSNDRATLRLARLENGVDDLVGDHDVSQDADLPFILSDMVQGYKEADSILLAGHIQRQLVRAARTRHRDVRDLGVKQGPFYVLDGTYMPSVLVETGFLTHAKESSRVASESYREALAEGIYRGIRSYLDDDRIAGVY